MARFLSCASNKGGGGGEVRRGPKILEEISSPNSIDGQ